MRRVVAGVAEDPGGHAGQSLTGRGEVAVPVQASGFATRQGCMGLGQRLVLRVELANEEQPIQVSLPVTSYRQEVPIPRIAGDVVEEPAEARPWAERHVVVSWRREGPRPPV